MNNIHVLLLSSVLSMGSLVMGADSASSKAPEVSFHAYRSSTKKENRITNVPFYVQKNDQRSLADIKSSIDCILQENGGGNVDGRFHVLSGKEETMISADSSVLKVADLDKYAPYILAFVAYDKDYKF